MENANLDFLAEDGSVLASLEIFAPTNRPGSLLILQPEEVAQNDEESVQIFEATRYEYELTGTKLRLRARSAHGILRPSNNPSMKNCGILDAGAFVGRLQLALVDQAEEVISVAAIEVRSKKLDYRDDFRVMLTEISEQSIELALELRSPTALKLLPEPAKSARAIYQQFAFLRGVIESKAFQDSVHLVVTRPNEQLGAELVLKDVNRGFKPSARALKDIAAAMRRSSIPTSHPLAVRMSSISTQINAFISISTDDTPENRFVRFVLEGFIGFLKRIKELIGTSKREDHKRLILEIERLERNLEQPLRSPVLAHVSKMDRLPLASSVLQRKEGYREILQAWLKFDMAARLGWGASNDVYFAGQQNVATLYEYWCFFKLLRLIGELCHYTTPPAEVLFGETSDGLQLCLRQGRNLNLLGHTEVHGKKLRIRFDYNRTFKRETLTSIAGSWSQRMRPDYTLTVWPEELSESEAEAGGRITHVHFDAKYRIEQVEQIFGMDDESLSEEDSEAEQEAIATEETLGIYKRADLLKMHAYKDAIRRSFGAYVLYPGSKSIQWHGYHELLPGLGAFVMRPGMKNGGLQQFLIDLLEHVANNLTDRAKIAELTADVYAGKTSKITKYP